MPADEPTLAGLDPADADRERHIDLLVRLLPERAQSMIRWLRVPSRRWTRIAAALLFLMGGVLWFLPILGIWMLPLGLVLLSDDVKPLRRATGRMLAWIERRRPHWLGLSYERGR